MAERRALLLALAGDDRAAASLPPESPAARHLPAAREALRAFCDGDETAMDAALKRIPFRSPYRDLRWLLEALVQYPADPEAGLRRLAKIAPDSPFRCPARAAEALLRGQRPAGKAAREFVAAFRPETAHDPRALFPALMEQAHRHPDDEGWRAALEALLVHHPQGLDAYEARYGALDRAERLRIWALHAERYGEPLQTYDHWVALKALYRERGDALRAAAVACHLAEMARHLGGPVDSEGVRHLLDARELDPDDREVWLALVEHCRLADDRQRHHQVVDEALQRFPDDPRIVAAAARTAFDRGSYREVARLYGRLLARDPLDREARRMALAALMGQARKQLAARRSDLARRTLDEAATLATDADGRARVRVLQGLTELAAGERLAAERRFDQARALMPSPLAEWMIAATALTLDHPAVDAGPLLKALRPVMDHAALRVPDKTCVLALLRDAAAVADEDRNRAQALLRCGRRYFRRALSCDWGLEELRELGELLLDLERWQWLRDLVRGHRLWPRKVPLLVWLDAEAKCRGVPENLDPYDVRRLLTALDQAAEAGDTGLARRIDRLVTARSPFGAETAGPAPERDAHDPDMTPEELLRAVVDLFGGVFARRRKQ